MNLLKKILDPLLATVLCYIFSKNAVKFLFSDKVAVNGVENQFWFQVIAFFSMAAVVLLCYFMKTKRLGSVLYMIAFFLFCWFYAVWFERNLDIIYLMDAGIKVLGLSLLTLFIFAYAVYWIKRLDVKLYGPDPNQ